MEIPKEHNGSEFVKHVPCDNCGSRDNAALYSDDHIFCFGCQSYTPGDLLEIISEKPKLNKSLIEGQYTALRSRLITEATCRKFDYQVGMYKGAPVQIANYKNDNGEVVAQKLRDANKNFNILGEAAKMALYGQHLWSPGKMVTVVEGEIDALTVSQVQGNKYPVVSLPNGAQSAKKAVLKNWDFLNQYETIVLFFDNDEAGQQSALACAESLPLGKVKIAKMQDFKDPNEALLGGSEKQIIDAIWRAKPWTPEGIVSWREQKHRVLETGEASTVTYPYQRLNTITKGIRESTMVTICAGSGVGKSTFITEIAYHLNRAGHNVGMLMLEEENPKTMRQICGIHINKNIVQEPKQATDAEVLQAYEDIGQYNNIALFDHFGATNLDTIIMQIQYMNKAMDCSHIFLDHLSIIVSSMTGKVQDERRLTDQICTQLRTLCQQLKITLFVVSHLSRPQGEGHESGGKVKLHQLRSSHSIAQLSDFCIALNVDPELEDTREISVLKNRFTGQTGFAGTLRYHRDSGRLIDADSATTALF